MNAKKSGNGFGTISRAIFLAEETGQSYLEIMTQAEGVGWGKLFKDAGLRPGGGGHGLGWLVGKHAGHGPPDHAGPPEWNNGAKGPPPHSNAGGPED
jgi:hypothetical protein